VISTSGGEEYDEAEPVAWSTNPVLRMALSSGALKLEMEEENNGCRVVLEENDLHQAANLREERKSSLRRAFFVLLGVQLPAAVASYVASPMFELRSVVASIAALWVLLEIVSHSSSSRVVSVGVVLANLLFGILVSESIQGGMALGCDYELSQFVSGLLVAALITSLFICVIGDVYCIEHANNVQREVTDSTTRVDGWFMVLGITFSILWSPLHGVYLLARYLDWLLVETFLLSLSVARALLHRS
jgi:hypothetical protein